MAMISGGNVIYPTVMPDVKVRIFWLENAAPTTDASVYGATGRTPTSGDLACNVTTGNLYKRTGVDTWTRIDTL